MQPERHTVLVSQGCPQYNCCCCSAECLVPVLYGNLMHAASWVLVQLGTACQLRLATAALVCHAVLA